MIAEENRMKAARHHFYPRARQDRKPSPWWYFGRAVYVSRFDYWKIYLAFLIVGVSFGVLSALIPQMVYALGGVAILGILFLAYSLIGLYRMYGHPSRRYLKRLFNMGGIENGDVTVADLHIGTFRHAYAISDLLPEATIHTIDVWDSKLGFPEGAIQDVRDLEPIPSGHKRIHPIKATDFNLPFPDASCDVVVFGFGTHEVPAGGPREKLFSEAKRVLKAGGKILMFEHGYDLHNYLIFGPVIGHVTPKEDWITILKNHFTSVRYERTSHAVDLFSGMKNE
jgi:ubiquinone/menaquinone biosynthesis C-methylase UbiE